MLDAAIEKVTEQITKEISAVIAEFADETSGKFSAVDSRFDRLEDKIDTVISENRERDAMLAGHEGRLQRLESVADIPPVSSR